MCIAVDFGVQELSCSCGSIVVVIEVKLSQRLVFVGWDWLTGHSLQGEVVMLQIFIRFRVRRIVLRFFIIDSLLCVCLYSCIWWNGIPASTCYGYWSLGWYTGAGIVENAVCPHIICVFDGESEWHIVTINFVQLILVRIYCRAWLDSYIILIVVVRACAKLIPFWRVK